MSRRLYSFEAINYSLRPNKNVERKLITQTIVDIAASGILNIKNYRYVGFGSIWFSDFYLAHRILRIDDMVSIEKVQSRGKRLEFNRPYKCIKICIGNAGAVLPDVLNDKPTIVWLDYDGDLQKALSGDLEIAISNLAIGSILIVTVNAEVSQLSQRKIDDLEVSQQEYLEHILGRPLTSSEQLQLTQNGFPSLVGALLCQRIVGATLDCWADREFLPIWNFRYADGAEMVTVGGFIGDNNQHQQLVEILQNYSHFSFGRTQFHIEVPILTDREKREFDKFLPHSGPLNGIDLPFELRPAEIEAYKDYYLYYPVFGEMAH